MKEANGVRCWYKAKNFADVRHVDVRIIDNDTLALQQVASPPKPGYRLQFAVLSAPSARDGARTLHLLLLLAA